MGALTLLFICLLCFLSCAKESPTASDEQAPTVEVTFPRPNTSISGMAIIVVQATDNEGVTKVEIYIDDVLRYTGQTSPWEYSWETLYLSNGSKHSIVAKAYDRAGNAATSETINVVVNNDINNPPSATIVAPGDSSSYALGEEVLFFGEGRDALGNTMRPDQLAWFSDRDGFLGIGMSLSRDDLTADWHKITLVATDDHELTGEDAIAIHISTEANLFQMTHDDGIEENPCWSPDGRFLAYHSKHSGNYDIWKISVAGGTPTQVTTDPSDDWDPDWYGSEIIFNSLRDGDVDIWKISDSGENLVQVTDTPGWDFSPCWSPDGEHIVISSQMGGGAEALWILSMDSEDPQQLTTMPGYEPDWFFGDIVFWGRDGNIYVTSLAGMAPVQITWDPAKDSSPCWSPSGDAIAFTSDRTANEDIWIWSFSDSQLRQLTFHSGRDYSPAWSPDGRWIAFVSDRDGSSDIWTIEIQK